MGIALRMATTLQLHLEETYDVDNPTPDIVIRGESARRTLVCHVIECQTEANTLTN